MRLKRILAIAAGIAAVVLFHSATFSADAAQLPVTIATGTPGGIEYPVGNAICRLFNLDSERQARPCIGVGSQGSVENIERVESGEATFALAETDVAYAAFHGVGPFAAAGPDPKLRMLIALYPEEFTVITRPDTGIHDFQDLRGRSVGIGMTGAGFTFTRDAILGFYGWTISDADRLLELGPAEQDQALCSHQVDAIIFSAGHPDGLTQEATADCAAVLVPVAGPPVDRLLAADPYYVASVIPGGTYAGNPSDTATIGTRAVLVTSSDQSDALAHAVVQAVFDNFADFRRLHPALSGLIMQDMVPSQSVVPIHAGALAYFREAGLAP